MGGRSQRVPEERKAVIDAKCKVFMFDDSHIIRTEDWAAAFLVGRGRIAEIVNKANGPFFVTLKPCTTRGHVGLPRFRIRWWMAQIRRTATYSSRLRSSPLAPI